METLKELLKQQADILKHGNIKAINEINKQIFAIREKIRQNKARQKEQERSYRLEQAADRYCLTH